MIRALSCIAFVLLVSSCATHNQVNNDQVLAYVGDRIITIQDFLRRAEYSIRPTYCRQSNYIHKKIVLNSLIAEKITALEMGKINDNILDSPNFKKFLNGRKEQAMRQLFYNDFFYDSVSISKESIRENYLLGGRTIEIDYLSLPDLEMVKKFTGLLDRGISLDSIYSYLWQGETPSRTIQWFDREPSLIHKKLFKQDLKKDELIGPFKTEENTYLVMQVTGWLDQPAITEKEQELRWDDVKTRLTETDASTKYISYVEGLMTDKKIELVPEIFNEYASSAVNYYLKDEKEKKVALNQAIWDDVEQIDLEQLNKESDLDRSEIIFNYNDKNYSIGDFNNMLRSHPLVFRKRKMNKSEFRLQLKFAIADLLRDIEINQICYDKDLDKDWRVISNVSLWNDAYASKRYIDFHRSFKNSTEGELIDHFGPVIDSLQQAYSSQIKINMDVFETLELTSTDMVVTQRGIPYPIVVPSFPILTSDNRLDYGSVIN
tara:strand:- start:18951 stop:20417 length:1467 start_codon:yes stop_codon:yes gene_type:complete